MQETRTEHPAAASADTDLQSGLMLGQYELIRELGRGGMGQVFLARDVRLARRVAIKFLARQDEHLARRFQAEARATARCTHENIVVIHDVGEAHGHAYMVLEHLEGVTLRAWLREQWTEDEHLDPGAALAPTERFSGVPAARAVELMVPVVRALAHAHELGLVHRDLKPENIMLTHQGAIKVLDFGIAKVLAGRSGGLSDPQAAGPSSAEPDPSPGFETREGALVGTGPYMSPEQWGTGDIDGRSDIWAVGIILWEALTGQHPLAPLSRARLQEIADLDAPMPSLAERRPDLVPLAALIDRCLRKRKVERLASAATLLGALEPLLPERLTAARNPALDDNPYAGLAPFQESDATRFYGREREVAAMLARLRNQRLVTVTGPSGAGKSSFVRAGVIPALKRSGTPWEALIVRPGRDPLAALGEVLRRGRIGGQPAQPAPGSDGHDPSGDLLLGQPGMLGAALRERARTRGHRILLFVDQLEELYTLGADRETREQFVRCLEGVADDASSPLRVVLSIRSDFLDRVAEDRSFTSELTSGIWFLPPMERACLLEAMTRPLEHTGHAFESPDIPTSLLRELETTSSPLPLLQFTASALWDARDRERRLITESSLHEMGGVAGALSRHADVVLAGMSPAERRLTRAVFSRLVTPERTRAIVSMDELHALGPRALVEHVTRRLADARLVLVDSDSEHDATVEIIHESLIDGWATLGRWLDEDREDAAFMARLTGAARQWESGGRDDGFLWRGQAADDARKWFQGRRGQAHAHLEPGTREARYLAAVIELAERTEDQARRRKKLRRALVASAFAALLTVVVVVVGLNRDLGAERGRARALAEESHTRLLELYKEQGRQALLADDPMRAFVYLREALHGMGDDAATWFMLARAVDALDDQALMLHAHTGNVFAVRFSPDSTRLASTGSDGLVKIWDARSGALLHALPAHTEAGWKLEYNATGALLASASWDDTARIWDARAGALLWTAEHQANVMDIAFSGDGEVLATASRDRTAKVWDARTGRLIRTLEDPEHEITAVALDARGEYLASGTRGGITRVFRVADGALLASAGGLERIMDLAMSPDGRRVASAGNDGLAIILPLGDDESDDQVRVLRGHGDAILSLAFSPDGSSLVTASADGTARIWNAVTGQPVTTLDAHPSGVVRVLFAPDSRRVLTGGYDGTARIWSVASGERLWIFVGHRDGVWTADINPDGKRVVTGSFDGTIRVWNGMERTRHVTALPPATGRMQDVAFAPDADTIASAHADGSVHLWSRDGALRHTFALTPRDELDVMRVAWHPDGSRILGSGGRVAVEWDVVTRTPVRTFQDRGDRVYHAIYSPDGKRIATAGQDGAVTLHDARTGDVTATLAADAGKVVFLDFDPTGELLVTAGADRTVRRWRVADASLERILGEHRQGINTVRFSPDSTRIVLATEDKSAEIWSATTGQVLVRLEGHGNEVQSAAFSPDGHFVATASDDRTVKIWDAGSGIQLWSVDLHQSLGNALAFSRDGQYLIGAIDRMARIWDVGHESRDLAWLDRFGACRVEYTLVHGRLERRDIDARACSSP